ncbi:hypothetical protein [Azospirillum sp. sgz302134]
MHTPWTGSSSKRVPPTGRPAARLLAAGAILALGACAEAGDPPRPMASISPLELVGLSVETIEPDRILGTVEDVVLTPNREPVQLLVASGAPMYPLKRRVAVDTGNVRYSGERQALVLVGMTPEQFAALPDRSGAIPAGLAPLPGATDATNWYRATAPAPR